MCVSFQKFVVWFLTLREAEETTRWSEGKGKCVHSLKCYKKEGREEGKLDCVSSRICCMITKINQRGKERKREPERENTHISRTFFVVPYMVP